MDKTAWQNNDPEWALQRKKKWDGLQWYLKTQIDDLDIENPAEYLKQAENFFNGTHIEYPTEYCDRVNSPTWHVRLLLHPDPSVKNIKELFEDWDKKSQNRIDYYTKYYTMIQRRWAPLIQSGWVEERICDNFLEAMYGSSFAEAVAMRNADIKTTLVPSCEDLLTYLFSWSATRSDLDRDYLSYEPLLKQLLEMFLLIDNSGFLKIEFVLKRFFRFVNQFDSFETADLPKRRAFVELFSKSMLDIRDQLNPCFWPYIDTLNKS